MVKILRKQAVKKPVQPSAPTLKASALKIFDVPVDQIDDSAENPNEEDEATFDQLVEGVKADGFDEPCIVVPVTIEGHETGRYLMVSGHHRLKAAKYLKLATVPCVVKQGWDDDKRKIELMRRNMLRGQINPAKFTKLFDEVSKRYDKEQLKVLMGFTKRDAFDKLYKTVAAALPADQRKQLEQAKETVKSVDDLSSVLNTIFKEGGSTLDSGYMVFSFGGKKHHYFQIDNEVHTKLEQLEKDIKTSGASASEAFLALLNGGTLPAPPKTATLRKLKPKGTAHV